MSFHESCDLIRIEVRGDHTVLLAAAKTGNEDETEPAEIVLDEQIGNGDGKYYISQVLIATISDLEFLFFYLFRLVRSRGQQFHRDRSGNRVGFPGRWSLVDCIPYRSRWRGKRASGH